jgi:hypothetical protein
MELVQQPLLTLDPASVQFALLLVLRTRQQQAIVADSLLAAADEQVLNAAQDAVPMLEEADGESLARGNVTGNVSATRASSAACSSTIRLAMKSRSKSDNSVRSSLR